MTWVYVLSKKSDVAETVKTDWLPVVERQQDRLVNAIRTDRGGEFLRKEFSLWLKKNGIRHSLTMPYSPAMSGIAERVNRTITETARGLLIEAGLPDYFWPDAVRSACVAKNRALTHVGADKWVSYVEWIGRKPKVDMFRVFGCMCVALQRQGLHVPAAEEEGRGKSRFQAPNRLTYDAVGRPAKSALAGVALIVGDDEESDYDECAFVFFSPVEMPVEPTTLKEALESSDAEEWKKAMESELKSIEENGTWELVELPEGHKAITSKWLFNIKSDADAKIERYKSRLVAKGYQQKEKVDYNELFAPVVKPTTLRTLLAGAAIKGWVVKQMDVTTAFLNGVLEEEIFMAQPEGFDDGSGRVLKLKKNLYGLKQAPRQWYFKLRGVLEEIDFTPSTADHSLFMLCEGEQRSFMVVYVNDILIFSPSSDLVKEVMLKLQDKFKCKALGDVSFYLGLHIERDVEKRCMRCVKGPEEESVGEEERRRFHSLVSSLMYAAVNTRPLVAFAIGQEVGNASLFRVWGSRAFVRDTSTDKLSPGAIPCFFLGFVPNAPGWQFYHPTSCRVFPSHDVTFDESVPFYRLFPFRCAPPPLPPLFLAPGPPHVPFAACPLVGSLMDAAPRERAFSTIVIAQSTAIMVAANGRSTHLPSRHAFKSPRRLTSRPSFPCGISRLSPAPQSTAIMVAAMAMIHAFHVASPAAQAAVAALGAASTSATSAVASAATSAVTSEISAVPATAVLRQGWFIVLVAAGVVDKLMGLASGMAFESDWILVLAGPDRPVPLATANAMLRRVEQSCESTVASEESSSPLKTHSAVKEEENEAESTFSVVDGEQEEAERTCDVPASAPLPAPLSIVSVVAAPAAAAAAVKVLPYPAIQSHEVIPSSTNTNGEPAGGFRTPSGVAEVAEAAASAVGRVVGGLRSVVEAAREGWRCYVQQVVMPASMAYALLCFNAVLAPGGLMTSYLTLHGEWPSCTFEIQTRNPNLETSNTLILAGVHMRVIGEFSSACAAMGFAATRRAPRRSAGAAASAAVLFQALLLFLSLLTFSSISFAPPSLQQGLLLLFLLLIVSLLVLSRVGNWTFEIVDAQVIQTAVPAASANSFGSTEMALASLAELLMFALAIALHDPRYFGTLVLMSVAAVFAAATLYCSWLAWPDPRLAKVFPNQSGVWWRKVFCGETELGEIEGVEKGRFDEQTEGIAGNGKLG
ncbi:unnamed protein product [Closterium sp. NIES-53]